MAVDATSGAGGLAVDASAFDAYYFAPQKCFGSDGGLWVALLSPAAVERIGTIAATGRWVPASMDLTIALDNSRLDQTYNTPALATLFLFDDQVRWFNDNGGLAFSVGRSDRSAEILYTWADNAEFASPFVAREQDRSHVIGTIDFDDSIDAAVGGQGAPGQRDRRHRALPEAGPQPAAHRHVPRHRSRGRGGAVRLHHPRRGRARPVARPRGTA